MMKDQREKNQGDCVKHLKLSRSALIRVGEGKPFEKQQRTVNNRVKRVAEVTL